MQTLTVKVGGPWALLSGETDWGRVDKVTVLPGSTDVHFVIRVGDQGRLPGREEEASELGLSGCGGFLAKETAWERSRARGVLPRL